MKFRWDFGHFNHKPHAEFYIENYIATDIFGLVSFYKTKPTGFVRVQKSKDVSNNPPLSLINCLDIQYNWYEYIYWGQEDGISLTQNSIKPHADFYIEY